MSFTASTGTDARRHELLADCAESVALRLIQNHGIDETVACDVGNSIADFLADHWKGQTFYLPADQAYRLDKRDWEIFNRMGRGRAPDLAKEYNLSEVRIYQIHSRCLAEYRRRVQGGLFPEEAAADNAAIPRS